MTKISAFFGVSRAPFLVLPVALVVCGAGASAYNRSFSWWHTLLALMGLVTLHMAVNILNEVSDYRTGIDFETEATPFSGGSGTLPSGSMTPRTAQIFATFCSFIGSAIGLYFLIEIGSPMVPLIVAGAILVLSYTDLIARHGVGEIAAGFGLGTLPVLGTALVQTGRLGSAAIVVSIPAFLMTFNLLLLNEFPDERADRHGGRRNLVLILGRAWAARIYIGAALAVPLILAIGVWMEFLPTLSLIAAAPTLLLAPAFRWAVRSPESNPSNPALGANVIWNLATNSVLGVVLFLAALRH